MLYMPTFWHTSKICFSLPRCAKCGKDHLTADCEETTPFCVNCKSDHTADDPQCPSFLSRQRKGAERRRKEKENNFNTNSQNIDYLIPSLANFNLQIESEILLFAALQN